MLGSATGGRGGWGGNRFLDYEPDVSGRMGTRGDARERISKRREGKVWPHFRSFIWSQSRSPTVVSHRGTRPGDTEFGDTNAAFAI